MIEAQDVFIQGKGREKEGRKTSRAKFKVRDYPALELRNTGRMLSTMGKKRREESVKT